MRTDYLIGFLQWLEREHDIDLVIEELSDYGDGCSNLHKVSYEKQFELAKKYRRDLDASLHKRAVSTVQR